jgi:predicted AAA+ superfamily ATPase
MIVPRLIESVLGKLARQYPVVTVTGPRQSGKTTLCRKVFPKKPYVNLEAPDVRRFAVEDPRGFLARHPTGAIFDEIQRAPELLSYMQGLVDESRRNGIFILTGSRQFEMLASVTQSLAGRTALLKLLPFSMEEMKGSFGLTSVDRLIVTGFYPRIYDQKLDPNQALGDYFETYVERDLRQVGMVRDLSLFRTFVRLCAGRIGQLLNLHSLANDVGISHTTARSWMSLLEASYIVYLLPPLHANIGKRLMKSPKLYFYDVGLAGYLLGLRDERQAERDPLRGSLFENLIVMEVLKYYLNRGERRTLSFYRDSAGNEVDLVVELSRSYVPIEIKAGATITDDYFKGLRHFSKVFGGKVKSSGLIYGGSDLQQRTEWLIVPAFETTTLMRQIVAGK